MKLQDLGFTEGEAQIYETLLKLGKANVAELAQHTGRHRTHIYDTIEKLKEKGLIAETIIENKKYLLPTNPENILSYLQEKQKQAQQLVNRLKSRQTTPEKILVETHQGAQGLKAVLRDILSEKQDYQGYGEGTRFPKLLPEFFDQFRGKAETLKLKAKFIFKPGTKTPTRKHLQIKHLDTISPATTFIYSNKVAIIIWEPFPTAIKITSSEVAKSYKNYFSLLWKLAK